MVRRVCTIALLLVLGFATPGLAQRIHSRTALNAILGPGGNTVVFDNALMQGPDAAWHWQVLTMSGFVFDGGSCWFDYSGTSIVLNTFSLCGRPYAYYDGEYGFSRKMTMFVPAGVNTIGYDLTIYPSVPTGYPVDDICGAAAAVYSDHSYSVFCGMRFSSPIGALTFYSAGGSSTDFTPMVSNITFGTVTPEPASALLFGTGLLALSALRARRRHSEDRQE